MATILLAEDDASTREIARIVLERGGHAVLEASSGTEALALLKKENVDLLLLDIMLPGLDGHSLLLQLAEDGRLTAVELAYTDGIVITGIDTGSPAAKANLGYSDLIYYVDNVNVPTVGAFCDVLRSRKAGDKIRIDITRTYTNGNHEDLYAEVVLE